MPLFQQLVSIIMVTVNIGDRVAGRLFPGGLLLCEERIRIFFFLSVKYTAVYNFIQI